MAVIIASLGSSYANSSFGEGAGAGLANKIGQTFTVATDVKVTDVIFRLSKVLVT